MCIPGFERARVILVRSHRNQWSDSAVYREEEAGEVEEREAGTGSDRRQTQEAAATAVLCGKMMDCQSFVKQNYWEDNPMQVKYER